jgi:formylglycine-generating enzyme required for sulfatase activity
MVGAVARRPVINVSREDAKAYIDWPSKETGQPYRLLSEAEWEYVARAGTTTWHWWGDDITPENANYRDSKIGKTTEVGSYSANPWGLHDVNGNVWEWGEDCWNDNYQGAPDDGSAWTSGDCSLRMIRGGSWTSNRGILRAAYRNRHKSTDRDNNIGFRVARTLKTQQ